MKEKISFKNVLVLLAVILQSFLLFTFFVLYYLSFFISINYKNLGDFIQSIAISITAIVTSYVAIKGLKTWQEQLKGTTKYQIAKDLLEKTYLLLDGIEKMRYYNDDELEESKTKRTKQAENYEYFKCLGKVDKIASDLKIIKFKAIAVFEKNIIEDIDNLLIKVKKLFIAHVDYAGLRLENNQDKKIIEKIEREKKILFKQRENDGFEKDLKDKIIDIENKLGKYLR